MKRLLTSILIGGFNLVFFTFYFIVNLFLMMFYGFKLPKVSPYHVSNPMVGNISEREFFNDPFVQSREFPFIPPDKKNKVIFLDIDGVLNVYCHDRDRYGCLFHDHFVENLRRVIDQTGAKIVITSTWRMSGLDVIKNMWRDRNLPGEVIDITCLDNEVVRRGICNSTDDVVRGHEIQVWLNDHVDEISTYCIIDDDSDMLPSQMGNFVKTSENTSHADCVDIGYGLTSVCADDVIRILNKTSKNETNPWFYTKEVLPFGRS